MNAARKILAVWLFAGANIAENLGGAATHTLFVIASEVKPKPRPRQKKAEKPAWYREAIEVRE